MIGRIPITDISPTITFGGEFIPAKATPGEELEISATIFREGHDAVSARILLHSEKGELISISPLKEVWLGSDRFTGRISLSELGDFTFTIEAFDDPYATWRHDSEIKISANIDTELCCEIGALILEESLAQDIAAKSILQPALTALRDKSLAPANRFSTASAEPVREFFRNFPLRRLVTLSQAFPIRVDRSRAEYGAWYEFFPRSEGATAKASGTFKSAQRRLKDIADMGFNVLYLPPIHPIGESFRKGPNNSIAATPVDPGVPWAIGNSEGGHDAINPELGTMQDFADFVTAAKDVGLEIALDLALQVSPDHPWVTSHPDWFSHRPDGTIAYAENPPKKYQDIFPMNFDHDYAGILQEVLRVIRLWVSKGVTLFRVDNPHTKPVHFWKELLEIVYRETPEIIFLAEAFTRPPMMHALGKVGFHQSYTYFTWRTNKEDLISYGNEVAHETSAFFRPNFWVNTPDILPLHLQSGIPAMFALRAVLAATLVPSWGMYAGYELFEHRPVKEGHEEYLDSEKYQVRVRDWEGARRKGTTLAPFITQLNHIRRSHLALQRLRNLVFHKTDSDAIIAYSKREGSDLILIVVNLDPTYAQETTVHWDLDALRITAQKFVVTDLLDNRAYEWNRDTFIRLDPSRPTGKVAHIVSVTLS